eukprot:IDg1829t1
MTERGGTIISHFNIRSLSDYELAMNRYTRLIVLKSLPVSYVEDLIVRQFSKFNVNIKRETIECVLYKIVEIVEKRITSVMRDTRGALIYDGWSCNGTHYVGVFASYLTARVT